METKRNKKLQEAKDIVTSLIDIIAKLTLKNYEQFNDMIKIVMKTLSEKDPYTQGHSIRVNEYALKIGEALNLDKEVMKELELAAIFHDIGKLGIPDKILKKPGRLTKEEFEIMRQHSEKGEQILSGITDLDPYKKYVRSHHERYDGFGYPDGLKAEEIPLISRIIFVADSFDAMTSDRPYRKGLSIEAAVDELMKCSGTQFDPFIVYTFVKIIKETYIEEAV